MPAGGSMRTSAGYDAPAGGYIYHLTEYLKGTLNSDALFP